MSLYLSQILKVSLIGGPSQEAPKKLTYFLAYHEERIKTICILQILSISQIHPGKVSIELQA